MITFLLTLLLGTMLVGIPILLCIALIGFIGIAILPELVMPLFAQKMFGQLDSFTLLAMPYFILAGSIMTAGGISRQLVDFARALVGHFRAGLAHASVVASMAVAGVSGSSTADAAAIGSIVIPTMKETGYKPGFAAALIATAGTIGAIIPPSMTMVIYGAIAQVSIGGLFLGGIIPGILVGLALMITVKLYTYHPGYPELREVTARFDLCALWLSVRSAWSGLVAPLIVVGGILSGVFTATEAGVIACVYAFIIGYFVEGKIKLANVGSILVDSAITTAMVSGIIAVSGPMGWLLSYLEFNEIALAFVTSLSQSPTVVLLIIVLVMLVLGTCRFADRAPGFRAGRDQHQQDLWPRRLSGRPCDGDVQPDRRCVAAHRSAPIRNNQHREYADRSDQQARLDLHAGRDDRPAAGDSLSRAVILDSNLLSRITRAAIVNHKGWRQPAYGTFRPDLSERDGTEKTR
jgi:tripartite ATP-independent transporter DctM subunit